MAQDYFNLSNLTFLGKNEVNIVERQLTHFPYNFTVYKCSHGQKLDLLTLDH